MNNGNAELALIIERYHYLTLGKTRLRFQKRAYPLPAGGGTWSEAGIKEARK